MEAADAASLAVHTQDLAKRYGKTVALSGLTMSVRRAEVFGFLGPNGAGKTTAVKLLVGLAHPTAGEAWVLGAPVGDLQTRRRIGYLPELFRYQNWMKAREVLGLHCELSGMPRSYWKAEIASALELVGLSDRADDTVEGFSKGMQQRLGLGVASVGRPERGAFGNLEDEGEWLTFRGLSSDRVPQLVAEIVRQGGRIYAVEPRHETLEDRFLQLLKEQDQ